MLKLKIYITFAVFQKGNPSKFIEKNIFLGSVYNGLRPVQMLYVQMYAKNKHLVRKVMFVIHCMLLLFNNYTRGQMRSEYR